MDFDSLTRQLLESKKIDERREAAMSISRNPDKMTIPPLIQSLADHEDVSIFSTLALVSIGKPAIPFLIENLSSTNDRVRGSCAEILGELQAEEALTALIDLLHRESSTAIKQSVVEAIGRYKNDTAKQELQNLLENKEPIIVTFAALALHRNGSNNDLYKNLVQLLKDAKEEHQSIISWGLVEICGRSKIPFLRKYAENSADEKFKAILDEIIHGISVKYQN